MRPPNNHPYPKNPHPRPKKLLNRSTFSRFETSLKNQIFSQNYTTGKVSSRKLFFSHVSALTSILFGFVFFGFFGLWGCQAQSDRNTPQIVTSHLVKLLQDPSPDVRRTAAQSLGKIADPTGEQALVKALEDLDPQVREYSVWALGQIGEEVDNTTALALVKALGDTQSNVKRAAASALGRIGTRQVVVELLTEAIRMRETEMLRYSVEALSELDSPSAYVELISALNVSDARIRQVAIAALGELGDPRALPAIRNRLLQDPDIGVRTEAAFRLGKLGDQNDRPALLQAAERDPDPLVHFWSTWAIAMIDSSSNSH